MLLGELINKYIDLDSKINMYYKSVENMDLDGSRLNTILSEVFDDISKYYSYLYSLKSSIQDIYVKLNENEEVTLYNVFMLRDITSKKLNFIDNVIKENSYDLDLNSLIDTRKSLVEDLQYLDSVINKTVWSMEVDSKSMG